ncbi:MAG: nucleotidyltransferase domain-containing protein [Clostridia bacterium]|nr:nucleotidyltransferase domain-containing protein [Clostridia bacterium]
MRNLNQIIDTIKEKLIEIEKRENIKILHCVESGSRAWGFPSPDSDYDVRFIYVRPKEYYLRLDKTRDVIEWQLDETLDINGWDLQKMLRLLHSSNPTVFEWKNSPIVYKTSDEWESISKVFDDYFSAKSGIYHYLSMAKTNYREYLKGDVVRLKKYFYVLRPLLACEYIRENQKSPPMLFKNLLCYLDGEVKNEVLKLLELKMKTSELGEGKAVTCINKYIEDKISEFDEYAKGMFAFQKPEWDTLNNLFLEII